MPHITMVPEAWQFRKEDPPPLTVTYLSAAADLGGAMGALTPTSLAMAW